MPAYLTQQPLALRIRPAVSDEIFRPDAAVISLNEAWGSESERWYVCLLSEKLKL